MILSLRSAPLAFLVVLFACSAPDTEGVVLIGHGGTGTSGDHPMNSGMALWKGLEGGLPGVEMDVQMTLDSVLVLFHDEAFTGSAPCAGKVNSVTWAAFQKCHTAEALGLDTFLFAAQRSYPAADFTLDVKLHTDGEWWPYMEAISDALANLEAGMDTQGKILVECQEPTLLQLVQRKAPTMPVYLYIADADLGVQQAIELGVAGVTIRHDLISGTQVEFAHAHGLNVTVFGVNGRWSMEQAMERKPDRIQTDYLP